MSDTTTNPLSEFTPKTRMPSTSAPEKLVHEIAEELAERVAAGEDGRNSIFETLVRDEIDLDGLVAYALYKQNKRDWLMAFEKAHGRPPDPRELGAYIIGERTARRIETYRRLASDALAMRLRQLDAGARAQTQPRAAGDIPRAAEAPRPLDLGATRANGGPAPLARPPAEAPAGPRIVGIVAVAVAVATAAYFGLRKFYF